MAQPDIIQSSPITSVQQAREQPDQIRTVAHLDEQGVEHGTVILSQIQREANMLNSKEDRALYVKMFNEVPNQSTTPADHPQATLTADGSIEITPAHGIYLGPVGTEADINHTPPPWVSTDRTNVRAMIDEFIARDDHWPTVGDIVAGSPGPLINGGPPDDAAGLLQGTIVDRK
jgi:hypothetical protein